jgi:cell division protein FtsL
MSLLKNKKLRLYIFGGIIFIGLLYLFANQYGLIKYNRLSNQVDSLKEQLEALKKENQMLQAQIDSLKRKIPVAVEKLARQKYDMIRPGEKKIEIIEE